MGEGHGGKENSVQKPIWNQVAFCKWMVWTAEYLQGQAHNANVLWQNIGLD